MPRVFSAASQQACLVALPVALLLHRALVVLLLALGEPDLHFGAAVLPVQLQRHDRVAAPLHRAEQSLQLAAPEQQLAGAHRVGRHVRGGGGQGGEVRASTGSLAPAPIEIGVLLMSGGRGFLLCAPPSPLPSPPTLKRTRLTTRQ